MLSSRQIGCGKEIQEIGHVREGADRSVAVIDVVVVERDQIEKRLVYEGMVRGHESMRHLMRVKEEYADTVSKVRKIFLTPMDFSQI